MNLALEHFSEAYGNSFILFVIFSICVGALMEIVKKNVFKPLDAYFENVEISGKGKAVYRAAKYGSYGVLALAISLWFVRSLIATMPFPSIEDGRMVLYPLYVTLFYLLQLLVSMTGIKAIVNRVTAPARPKKRYKKVLIEEDDDEEN